MASTVGYHDFDPEETTTCKRCDWSGRSSQASSEVFNELMTVDCPRCDHRLMTVLFPTEGETREAATAGQRDAVRALAGFERAELASQLELRSAAQLPDLPLQRIRLEWDMEERDGERWTVLRSGPIVVWQELAHWEGYLRFVDVVGILRLRYGPRLQEVRPTTRAELYLYGDSLRARSLVREVNAKLSRAQQPDGPVESTSGPALRRDRSDLPPLEVSHHFASDADGTRHLIVDEPNMDCQSWRVETWPSQTGAREVKHELREFRRGRIWGIGQAVNFLGIGPSRTAWVAIVDHDESAVVILPGGSRYRPGRR